MDTGNCYTICGVQTEFLHNSWKEKKKGLDHQGFLLILFSILPEI